MTFTILYCIIGRVLAIVDGFNVKHYVDNINRKYTVTMAMTPPTVNMAGTLHVLNVHLMFDELYIRDRYPLTSRLSYST